MTGVMAHALILTALHVDRKPPLAIERLIEGRRALQANERRKHRLALMNTCALVALHAHGLRWKRVSYASR